MKREGKTVKSGATLTTHLLDRSGFTASKLIQELDTHTMEYHAA